MYIFIFFSFPSSFLPTRCGKSSFINAPACAASFASHSICVMPYRGTFVLQTVCRTIATPEKAQELSSKWETCFSLALWGGGGRGEIENKSPYPNALTSIVRSMQRPFLANATTCCFVICKPVIYWRGVHLEANFSIYKILSFFSSFLSTFCHSAIAIVLRPRLQPPTKVPFLCILLATYHRISQPLPRSSFCPWLHAAMRQNARVLIPSANRVCPKMAFTESWPGFWCRWYWSMRACCIIRWSSYHGIVCSCCYGTSPAYLVRLFLF